MAIQRRSMEGHIVRNPRVLGGEPIVRGTRIPVRSIVLASHEYGGPVGVRDAYPQLTMENVVDALAYYQAHQAEIDQYIRANLDEG